TGGVGKFGRVARSRASGKESERELDLDRPGTAASRSASTRSGRSVARVLLASANTGEGQVSPGFRAGLRWLGGIAVICGSLWFMVSQLSLNLGRLGAELTRIPAWGIAVTTLIFAASVLVDNAIWYSILRSIQGQALSPTDTFAVLNLSAVGKYLPGKVWAYAWQIYLFDRRGISPRASLWTNAITALAASAAG